MKDLFNRYDLDMEMAEFEKPKSPICTAEFCGLFYQKPFASQLISFL